jgi:acyl-CoA thioester hydrolase
MSHQKIRVDITVRFRDIDAMGHVNNAVFFTYFEEGRKVFLQSLFDIVRPEDYNFILANISCDFLKPVKIGDPVILELWVGETGRKRFDLKYRIVNRDDASIIYAKARSVQVCFDYKSNRTISVPPEFLKKIEDYIESTA